MNAGADVEADRAIMAFIRESRKAHELPRVGPFALLLTGVTPLRYLNYAIPDDGADPDDAELDALVAAFRTADRAPRVEFLPTVAPALEPRLTARGWTLEARLPLMTCTRTTIREARRPDGIVIEKPSDDGALLEMARLQHAIFEDPEPADERTVARLRGSLSRGGRALVAREEGTRRLVGAANPGCRPAGPPRSSASWWHRPIAAAGLPPRWYPRSLAKASTPGSRPSSSRRRAVPTGPTETPGSGGRRRACTYRWVGDVDA